jgi:TetR/AcrR family transcriptional regulator, ethionamide resistance regulator
MRENTTPDVEPPYMPSVTRAAQASRPDRRAALEDRLLAATERLVGRGESFTEVSVERLAAQAGISRSTFYVHFQDKGDLARHLARRVLAELRDVSDHWWQTAEHAVRADLASAMGAIVAVYRRHPGTFTAVMETATYDIALADELRTLLQAIIDATRAAIERGQAAGVMRPVPPAETAAVLSWMVERAGYQLVRGSDPAGDPTIVEVLTDIIWTTLYGH